MSSLAPTAVETIDAFFDGLASRGHVPLIAHVNGTLEFNIEGSGRRWVTIHHGDIAVSHNPANVDCMMTCDSATFSRIISGKQNVIAAAIRGSVRVEGNLALGLSILRVANQSDG